MNKKLCSSVFLICASIHLSSAGTVWCEQSGADRELNELKNRVKTLEQQVEIEKLKDKLETLEKNNNQPIQTKSFVMPSRNKLRNRFELGIMGYLPSKTNEYSTIPRYGFNGEFGYNFTNWFQLGLETGIFILNYKYVNTYSDSNEYYHYQDEWQERVIYLTPRVKFQFYLGRYIQPFVTTGMGLYNGYYSGTVTYTDNYYSTYSKIYYAYSNRYNYYGNYNNFGINSNIGINIGPKDGVFKISIKGRYDKFVASENLLSFGLGIICAF